MGTLDSRLFSIAGILSAVLFAVAGVLCITGTFSEINYVAISAGVLAIVSSFGPMIGGRTFARKVSGIFVALAGFLAILSFLSEPLIGVAGIVAAVAMVMDALNSWVAKVKGLMSVSALFAAIELVVAVLSLVEGGPLYDGLLFVIFGAWIAVSIVSRMVLTDSLPAHAHRDESKKVETTEQEPKKVESKPQPKVEAPKQEPKAEPAKPVRTVEMPKVPKQEPKKVEEPKAEPRKEEPKPQPKVETVKAVPVQNNDFLKKLKGSKDVHRASEPQPKVEVERVAPAVETVHEEVQKVGEQTGSKVEESTSDVHAEPVHEETQPVAPVVETTPEETIPEEPVVDDTVAEDASEDVPDAEEVSEEQTEVPMEETIPEEVSEPVDITGADEVPTEPVTDADQEEPVSEDITVLEEDPQDGSVSDEASMEEPVDVPGAESSVEGNIDEGTPSDAEEELGEDIFTDNSPEALVRRAAWNKGLRCRRGYGEHNIPVAFVKGKVAVYVEDADADTSIDAVLTEEGWTVLRYDASSITDGKLQGEEINQAVKANNRAAKASSKKKKKAPSKK